MERAETLLRYFEKKTQTPGEWIKFHPNLDSPLVDAGGVKAGSVFGFYLGYLKSAGLIEQATSMGEEVRITFEGWLHLHPIGGGGRRGHVFIAMSYADDLRSVFDEGLAAAVRDCGMIPVLQADDRHTGNIIQRMLGQIRSCELVVADLTGERPNVYYETGFAQGIARPVIFTCKKGERVHFDTAQFPRIEWETMGQLRRELADWLRAITPSAKASGI